MRTRFADAVAVCALFACACAWSGGYDFDGYQGSAAQTAGSQGEDASSPDSSPVAGCVSVTCAELGAACGNVPDGCDGTLDCGTCTAPQTCGGAGLAKKCGCAPTTCSAVGAQCGTISNGCGGLLDCGQCPKSLACGLKDANKCSKER